MQTLIVTFFLMREFSRIHLYFSCIQLWDLFLFLFPEDDKRQEKGSKLAFQSANLCQVCTFAFQNSHQWDFSSMIPTNKGSRTQKQGC